MLKKLRNRFLPLFIAVIITTIGSIPYFLMNENNRNIVYACSPIIQIGMAIMVNVSTSLISDVIGKNADSSAFVYGFYSFVEKIANGIAIQQAMANFKGKPEPLKIIMGGIPIFCALFAFLLTFLGKFLYSEKQVRLTVAGSKNRNKM